MGLYNFLSAHIGAKAQTGDDTRSVAVVQLDDIARRLEILDDFEQAGIGWIWATDHECKLTYLSESATAQLGLASGALLARSLGSVFEADPANPKAKSDRPLSFIVAAHTKIVDMIVRVIDQQRPARRKPVWWSITGHPKFDEAGNFVGYRGSAKDVTVEYERTLVDSRLAEYDSLTGLANRHRMARRLDATLATFKAAKRSVALMMIDLDRFKQVNDTMGHPAGDALLKTVAQRLNTVVGSRGEIGRLGGDEFQIQIPDIEDRGTLGEMAEKIIQMVSQPYMIDGKHAVIGASVGIAIAPYDGLDRVELTCNADLALYAAKHGGRGQFRLYSDDLKDAATERQQLVGELRDALESGGLNLYYQPVVRVADNIVVGCEALLRWEHPERGPISPATFVPLAEEAHLIDQLGEWALFRACRDAANWPTSVRVAVNVSATQFGNSQFVNTVAAALEASRLDPSRLELELTESVFLNDLETTEGIIRELKQIGVTLALDDFGTGFSSLSYLRSAPFDKIKVDRSFVDSCTQTDRNSLKIIAAIISLADALGMETTVEGVEAFDQLELVCSKGAKYVQGWLYSKAMPLAELHERMESGEFEILPTGPALYRPERRSVFRRIGVVHQDHRYEAIVRDLSLTGARVEGLIGVTQGEELVLDLGKGQLVIATVVRASEQCFSVAFETPLISDGAGGLYTRHRVSPYALASAGMPLSALGNCNNTLQLATGASCGKPKFVQVAVSQTRVA